MHSAPRALIAGLGLIGGSIGMALRARGWRVAFDDPHVTLGEARRAGAADETGGDADIVIIATPVDAAIEILQNAKRELRITSVCGVMLALREVADDQPRVLLRRALFALLDGDAPDLVVVWQDCRTPLPSLRTTEAAL